LLTLRRGMSVQFQHSIPGGLRQEELKVNFLLAGIGQVTGEEMQPGTCNLMASAAHHLHVDMGGQVNHHLHAAGGHTSDFRNSRAKMPGMSAGSAIK